MDRSQWHKWIFWYVCVVNQIRNLLMSREVIWKCKHQRSWTKLSRVRKGIEKASYRLIDSLWSTRQLLFAKCLFVACCVYRLWLFSLTARCSLGTVLTGMKPEVRYTSVASVVSLFVGVEKKMWPISHICDRVDRRRTWLPTLTTLRLLYNFRVHNPKNFIIFQK